MRSALRGVVRFLLSISRMACAAMLFVPAPLPAATLTVTSAGDTVAVDGAVSLREAIASINAGANANADMLASGVYGVDDAIHFDIAGGCATACRITLASSLGTLAKPVTIDGYTQPGSSVNTLAVGDNAAIRIEIDGDAVTTASLLTLTGGASTVRGLDIHGGVGHGALAMLVFASGDGYVVEGNFLGTDPTGSTAPAGFGGTAIYVAAPRVRVGGTAPQQRNLIAGTGVGVSIRDASTAMVIEGNYFGTDAFGLGFIGMGTAISVMAEGGATIGDVTIGGSSTGTGNVIAAALTGGIEIVADASVIGNVIIQGNLIGTNVTGMQPISNGNFGISAVQRSGGTIASVLIGGRPAGARNVISAGGGLGLLAAAVDASGVSNLTIQANDIGVGVDGTTIMGNDGPGVRLENSIALVGGTNAREGNVIANNRTGIIVIGASTATILRNSITQNDGFGLGTLGIDLGDDLVTANDTVDADSGPNELQNYPLLTLASQSGTKVWLSGALNSAPDTTFRVEFFSNAACSGSGNGEGKTFIGFRNVTTDGAGNATFGPLTFAVPAAETVFTSTATGPSGTTSEFSVCLKSIAAPIVQATPASIPTLTPRMAWMLGLLLALVGGLALRKR